SRQKRVDYVTGLLFAAASAPGVLLGTQVVHLIPQRLFSGLFGVLLLVLAVVAFRGSSIVIRAPVRGRGVLVRHVTDPEGRTYVYAYKLWQGIAISAGVGFISSLFGIGGGIIHVPVMIIVLHIPVAYAVATSHFVLVFMSGGATLIHLLDGSLGGEQLVKAAALAVGAVPGAQVGAILSHRIKGRVVLLMLSVAIVVLGTRVLLKAAIGL
ncbi:MAG: sulfite exporter TauE/SafE family protein, partial [Nevskiales bacterium]